MFQLSSSDVGAEGRSSPRRKFARSCAAPTGRALLFERLWPRVWLILGLAGVSLLVSLAGLWPMLSDPLHYVVLAAFALAGVAVLLTPFDALPLAR